MLKVTGIAELKLAAAHYARLDQPTRRAIREQSKAWAPTLVRAAEKRAAGMHPIAGALARSGKVTVTNKGLLAVFGRGTFRRGGRSVPLTRLTGYEFGANRGQYSTYLSRHRTTKQRITVKRRTKAQMPPRNPDGWFLYPAVADTTPELVGRWVRAIAEVARGR